VHVCRKNVVCDQFLESPAHAVGAVSKHELHSKSSKLPTSGKKNVSSTKQGSTVKVPEQTLLQSKVSVSKPHFGPDNSEIFTTDMLYYSSVADNVVDHELMDGDEVPGTSYLPFRQMFYVLVNILPNSFICAPHGTRVIFTMIALHSDDLSLE